MEEKNQKFRVSTGLSRRDFVKSSALAVGTIPLYNFKNLFPSKVDSENLSVNLFSKHLQFLNYEDMSNVAADLGFDGLDLTVRPGGHVLPENVDRDLPKAVRAMERAGLNINLMTTDITALEGDNENILRTAAKLGFKNYRMGWLQYPTNISIPEAIAEYQKQFVLLSKFNQKIGLLGSYQNHSGNYVGSPVWDLYEILNNRSALGVGCQYDIRHATVEGANSWGLALRLIKNRINTIVIKDFKWGGTINGRSILVNTPLGEGIVDFDTYFKFLKTHKIAVPVSLHLEYELGGAEHGKKRITMSKKEILQKIQKDLLFIKEKWKSA